MSAVAQRRPGHHDGPTMAPRSDLERLEYAAALAAVSELTLGTLGGGELRETLRQIAARACEVIRIRRAAVYVRDQTREVFHGVAAHPSTEIETAVRQLTLGGPTDRITLEIVATRAPLVIRDTRSDPRALVSAVRRWRLRSLLGVPMFAGDELLGLMIFDNAADVHRYAPVDVEIATTFANLGAAAVKLARGTSELRTALDTATRQNKLLRRTTVAEHRLSEALLNGGGLGAIVEIVSTLTGKPAVLYDANGQTVSGCSPSEHDGGVTLMEDACGEESVRRLLDDVVAGGSVTIEPRAGTDVPRRHLVAPVDVRGERWGWLVVVEQPTRLVTFDDFLIRRAATHLALELAGRRQMISSCADARALLARQLVRGTTVEEDLRRSAEYLGVAIDTERLVAYFSAPPGRVDVDAVVDGIRSRAGGDVLATKGPEGVVLLVELPESEVTSVGVRRIKRCVLEALESVSDVQLLVGMSTVCRTPAEIPGGYHVARQVARCIESFPHGHEHRVLAADDLGPGRLFVANGHPEEIERFVEDVLGPLLDPGETESIRTLEAFYDTGRSVRFTAERLGVHENTVRYRLARTHSMTGLDVAANPDDQLSVQVALLVLRLQCHPALRSLDATEPALPAANE